MAELQLEQFQVIFPKRFEIVKEHRPMFGEFVLTAYSTLSGLRVGMAEVQVFRSDLEQLRSEIDQILKGG